MTEPTTEAGRRLLEAIFDMDGGMPIDPGADILAIEAEARATVPDRPGILDDSIEGNVQRVDAIRVLELAAASQGYPDINGPSFLRDIEEGGYTLRLTTDDERRRRSDR